MAITSPPVPDLSRDLDRLDILIAAAESDLLARTSRSAELREEAFPHLAGGAASSWQMAPPRTMWVTHGAGAHLFDADGTDYVDMHAGFGVMLAGHAHPAIVHAVTTRVGLGTHFAQPTPDTIVVARELARRFGLPLWRFGNSGTEATMDAVHLMRHVTGRPRIVKMEGSYHGHHDAVLVSVYPEDVEAMGPHTQPGSVRAGPEIPEAVAALTIVVPFNDLDALASAFAAHPGEIAGVLMEPIMMNIGIIPPAPGYLAAVRDLTKANDALLAFDEVKTGLTVHPGGASAMFGVTPDIICLAKAMGGGLPCGAIGGSAELMAAIASGAYPQVGTFNGNPLTMAAARAMLTEVLVDEAYRHFDTLRDALVAGCEEVIRRYELPAYVRAYGAKGSVIFAGSEWTNYRDFLTVDERWGHCHWLYQHNGGVFLPPWGKGEQWTIGVQHTEADVLRYVANLERMAQHLVR